MQKREHISFVLFTIRCLYKRSVTRAVSNNKISFVNSLLHLIICRDGIHICKNYHIQVKKNKVPSHAVADKLFPGFSLRDFCFQEEFRCYNITGVMSVT